MGPAWLGLRRARPTHHKTLRLVHRVFPVKNQGVFRPPPFTDAWDTTLVGTRLRKHVLDIEIDLTSRDASAVQRVSSLVVALSMAGTRECSCRREDTWRRRGGVDPGFLYRALAAGRAAAGVTRGGNSRDHPRATRRKDDWRVIKQHEIGWYP